MWNIRSSLTGEVFIEGGAQKIYYWIRGNQSMIWNGHVADMDIGVYDGMGCAYLGPLSAFKLSKCPKIGQAMTAPGIAAKSWKKVIPHVFKPIAETQGGKII